MPTPPPPPENTCTEKTLQPDTLMEKSDGDNYIAQLDDIQKKAYLIAKKHLGTSFNIYKSNGFKEWKSKV